ncbi:MAG: ribonuclease D [Alphaproteobacteria bacterium CG_4_10_14_0_8_um_filter_37_21]|nr:MAG: ribonuclease D [Alphaproteobacteria bacterium CG_4_10_14_0_8_um_filter_37_21]
MQNNILIHQGDLPDDVSFTGSVAIDTEAMGLVHARDRLCVVQLFSGKDSDPVHLIQIPNTKNHQAPNLVKLLINKHITKIFHYARFDVSILMYTFNIEVDNIFCTKIASRLCRTYTGKHSLKDLCKDFLGVELSKEEQTSDWGSENLTELQQLYAAKDVLYLHKIKNALQLMLERENRVATVQACFDFLPTRVKIDHLAGEQFDIFSHKST